MDNNGQQQQHTNHNHVNFAHDGDYVNDIDEIIDGSYNNNERDLVYLDPDTILRLTRSRPSGESTAYSGGSRSTSRTAPSSDTITRDTTASTFASGTLPVTPSADGSFVSGGVEKKKKKMKKSIPGAYPSHHLASQEKLLRNSAPTQNFGGGGATTTTATDIDNHRAIQLEKQMILQLTRAYTNDSAATSIMTPGTTTGPPRIRGESSIPSISPNSRLSSRRPSNGLNSRLSSVRFSSDNNNHRHHQSNYDERHRAPVLEDYQSGVIIEPPPVHFAGGGGGGGRQFSEEPEGEEEPSAFSINFQIAHKRQEGCEREIPPLSSEATTRVEYFQPNNNHNPTVSSPETDSCISTLRKSKFAKFVALMFCIISVGLIISLIIVFVKDSNNEDFISSQKISTNLDLLVGDPLDGKSDSGMFGSSISMNRGGTRMAVADSNNVFVYELTYFDWVLVTKIEGGDEESSHDGGEQQSQNELIRSTIQVDISSDGNTLAISWPYSTNKDGLEPGTGRVEVYQEEEHFSGSTGWEKMGNTLYGQIGKEYFGTSVALNEDGTQIAIGSSGMDGSGGSAAIYTLLNQGLWLKKGDTLHLSGNRPITSVAFKGYTLAITGLQSTTTTTYGQGPVSQVYRYESFNWVELGNGFTGNNVAKETTAYLVDMSSSGNIVALSEYYVSNREHGDDGLGVRVYAWDGGDWIQMGENIFAPGKKSGYFISMSDDGKLLGMGHPGRPSEEEGDSLAGHICVFAFDDTSQLWEQIGPNYEGEDPGDHFGGAVALSGDGKYFAAGARFNGGTGIGLGRVYVLDVRNLADVESYGD